MKAAWLWARGWLLWALVLVSLAWLTINPDRSLELEQARYCHMVSMGYWPDYENSYDEACRGPGQEAAP